MKLKLPIRIIIISIATLIMLLAFLYFLMGVVILGPSQTVARTLVENLLQSSITDFIPGLYLEPSEIEALLASAEKII